MKDESKKVLHLNLKRQWYEMIDSGVKKEEYRDLSDYWVKRLCAIHRDYMCRVCKVIGCCRCQLEPPYNGVFRPKEFDAVCFHYGYTKRTMTFEVVNITIGTGNPDWGAPDIPVFIIKLGGRIYEAENQV